MGFHSVIEEWTGFSFKLLLLMCIHILMFPSFQYWAQKQRFLFEYKNLVVLTLLNSFLSLLLGVAFVLISEEKSLALISVTVGVQAIINLFIFVSLSRKGRCFYRKEFWIWSFVSALPLIPHYLSEILLGHADRIMINQMCGPSQAGIYNIVYQLSMIMTIVRTGINGSFIPWLFVSMKAGRYDAIRRNTSAITVMMAAMTFLLILIGPEILWLAAPSSYYEAIIDMPAIMIGCYFIFIYVLFLNIEIYFEQNQYVAIASCIAAVLSIVANVVFIPIFGYLSCGYTTMLSYVLMAVLHYFFFRRICAGNPDVKNVLNIGALFVISLALSILGISALLLYENHFVRWVIIISLFFFFFLKRDQSQKILKELKSK